ncbi:MAG: TIGR03943 family protein [Microbacterium sp.]|uniref:TIGR03943 family putative permease subunit n=1 Tax=Microbacterium sp. TaxID=51671 RepID=UPI0039E2A4BD
MREATGRSAALATRWLGVGLAACLAVVTLVLAVTGRLALYISPASNWFAIPMAALVLAGAVASFLLPLGAEDDHGHAHGGAHESHDHSRGRAHARADAHAGIHPHASSSLATVVGGVVASGVALTILLTPPASLSAEIAATRDVGAPPLFGGADLVQLATKGDTSSFGVGDWASVFATATNPDAFEGESVTLTGFATPAKGAESFSLTRLVITHCVIDAQVASIPVATTAAAPDKGQWVAVTGTVRSAPDGTLEVDAADVTAIDEPKDPYEY